MSQKKKEVRAAFRKAVFERDSFTCIGCGLWSDPKKAEEVLDAHHISPREEMPNGGYVCENGVTLCKNCCHKKAEAWLKNGTGEAGFSPKELYSKISTHK